MDHSGDSIEKLSGKDYTSPTWIPDSRVSNHMTNSKKLLREVKDMALMAVYLPNGAKTVDGWSSLFELWDRINWYYLCAEVNLQFNINLSIDFYDKLSKYVYLCALCDTGLYFEDVDKNGWAPGGWGRGSTASSLFGHTWW